MGQDAIAATLKRGRIQFAAGSLSPMPARCARRIAELGGSMMPPRTVIIIPHAEKPDDPHPDP